MVDPSLALQTLRVISDLNLTNKSFNKIIDITNETITANLS
jgi:hypothetical protein